jgi:hypothetical protein
MSTPLPSKRVQKRGNYRPTRQQITDIYNALNIEVFNGQLVRPSISIRSFPKEWGWCVIPDDELMRVKLRLDKTIYCIQWFVVILAHEMAHQYQWQVHGPVLKSNNQEPMLDHGETFFTFKDKMAEFNIPLLEMYDHKKWFKHQDLMKL